MLSRTLHLVLLETFSRLDASAARMEPRNDVLDFPKDQTGSLVAGDTVGFTGTLDTTLHSPGVEQHEAAPVAVQTEESAEQTLAALRRITETLIVEGNLGKMVPSGLLFEEIDVKEYRSKRFLCTQNSDLGDSAVYDDYLGMTHFDHKIDDGKVSTTVRFCSKS